MKKQLYIFSLCLFTSFHFNAQAPAGNNQEIQFNNNGAFGSSPYLKWDGANLRFLDLGTTSAKLYFQSETGDDSYVFSENWGTNKNRLVFYTRDDGNDDYAVFRNKHWNDGDKDVFEIHRTWTMSNSNFYVMNGNLGVGTLSPSEKLQIMDYTANESKWVASFKGGGQDIGTYTGIKIFNGYSSEYNKWIGLTAVSEYGASNITGLGFYTSENTNTHTEKVRITGNGNVGIGTTTPDSKLTVAGNIHTQEVKVTVDAGADFVFNEDYNLPSLEKIEQFIKANKHLPEIASEKEMKDNGLLLAEMNIKLLQKIEELTLYTIEQQKQINALLDKVEELQTRK